MNNILLIEDNNSAREDIASLLITEGYNVSKTDSGINAIKQFKKQLPDLVICEIIMPGMNAYDVYKNMAASLYANQIPFIYFTAKSGIACAQKIKVIKIKNFRCTLPTDCCLVDYVASCLIKRQP